MQECLSYNLRCTAKSRRRLGRKRRGEAVGRRRNFTKCDPPTPHCQGWRLVKVFVRCSKCSTLLGLCNGIDCGQGDRKVDQLPTVIGMPETALKFDDVHFAYVNPSNTVEVIRSLSFDVFNQEIFGLIGPSGCGKTTILRLAADLIAGQISGQVLVGGTSPRQSRAERRIAVLFQRPILLPWRNVLDNVLLPSQIAGENLSKSKAKAMGLLDLAGVADFAAWPIHEISGGMQQRVSLVRSLMTEPRLLCLDEPFASLDEVVKEDLLQLTQHIAQSLSLSVLHVSHSLEDSVLLCDRVAVLAPRPTTVSQLIDIPLSRPRHYQQRLEPGFVEALSSVREAVHANRRTVLRGGLL